MSRFAIAWSVVTLALATLAGSSAPGESWPISNTKDWLIQTWETEDGLPENSATAMVQTGDGYLWFGTFNGLVRFDGVKFRVFNPANTPGLPDAGIVNLHLDRAGRLWVSTYRGVAVRDGQQWRAVGKENDFVRTFSERSNGDLLITTFDGQVMEFSGDRLTALPAPPGESGMGYLGGVDEEGKWYVIQHGFIGRWDGRQWVTTPPPPQLPAGQVGCGPAQDGGLWLLSGKELRKYHRGVESSKIHLTDMAGTFWSLSEDRRGNVWICTSDNGLFQVTAAGQTRHWTTTNGLSYAGTRFVFEDRENALWVGTSGGGLMRWNQRRFQTFGTESGLGERVVHSVCPARGGGVWIATYGRGLFRLDETGLKPVPLAGGSGSSRLAQSVLEDRAGRVWLGTFGGGLFRLEQAKVERFEGNLTGGGNVISLYEDSRGRIWMGGGQTVSVYDGTRFQVFGEGENCPRGGVRCFAEDKDGVIWLSNLEGVFRFQDGRFVELQNGQGAIREITCLKLDRDGAMWLGSLSQGLLRWGNGRLAVVDGKAGLPVSAVHAIEEDALGFFWITSNRGIVRAGRRALDAVAEGKTLRVSGQHFDMSDGLSTIECTSGHQPAAGRDANGRLWFATVKGVATVDPANLRMNPTPPATHIEELTYYAASKRDGAASPKQTRLAAPFNGAVAVPPGSRRLEFHYSGLSFVAPERVRFQVKLEGENDEWEDGENRRVALYHDLKPGDYTFRVRSANNHGVWDEAGTGLAFKVEPFFWQTLWFQLSLGLALVGAGGGGVWWLSRVKIRLALERAAAAEEIKETHQRMDLAVEAAHLAEGQARELSGRFINAQEDERRRIARDLHDDLNQRLALLSVEMDLVGRAAQAGSQTVAPQLEGLTSHVKELSSEVHRLSYELHPAKLEQLGLLATARSFCRDLSKQSGIYIDFVAKDVPRDLPRELALCLYRVLQESLQNVVRHSGSEKAQVTMEIQDKHIRLWIADFGKGFDVEAARRNGGLGLVSMQERLRLIHGTIIFQSAPGKGSVIDVIAPLNGKPANAPAKADPQLKLI